MTMQTSEARQKGFTILEILMSSSCAAIMGVVAQQTFGQDKAERISQRRSHHVVGNRCTDRDEAVSAICRSREAPAASRMGPYLKAS
jgi:type II secretory pathway pseudopilin PulG